jgi:hypothetical protein
MPQMIEQPLLVLGLAGFDLLILAALGLFLRLYYRSRPRVSRLALIPVAFGLSGFVFHACLFFNGAVLILQLMTIGGVLGLLAFFACRRQRQP